MNIFTRLRSADAVYSKTQDKLIQLRVIVAQHIARSGNKFIKNRQRLDLAEQNIALLYSVKHIAENASISAANRNWENDFYKIASKITEEISSDTKYFKSHREFPQGDSSSQLIALTELLKQLIANSKSQTAINAPQNSQRLVEWLQKVRSELATRVQTWTDRAQIARNDQKIDIEAMAQSRRDSYLRIIEILDAALI